jgi:hypothetical protein
MQDILLHNTANIAASILNTSFYHLDLKLLRANQCVINPTPIFTIQVAVFSFENLFVAFRTQSCILNLSSVYHIPPPEQCKTDSKKAPRLLLSSLHIRSTCTATQYNPTLAQIQIPQLFQTSDHLDS